MATQHFILATAGHVDHGKSALVKALTGTDPDRLPEEKARGITIDLGFAYLELPGSGGSSSSSAPNTQPSPIYQLGIIDVPGHEDFVKNMVAGVGSIDLALLVVAADDGWMPQTEEHLQILTYLGVASGVIALTKIDLAGSHEAAVIESVREQLSGTPLADAPIVPTSIVNGRGLSELKSALSIVLSGLPPPRDIAKPRLPVDRVFTLHGIGTVVTGTLNGGWLKRGQTVVVQPSGKATRIRSLQNHNRDVEMSEPGTRTALNLPDAGGSTPPHGIAGVRRGDVITLPELGAASATLDVLLEMSPRLGGCKKVQRRPLRDRTQVRVHHGSGNFPAWVHFFDVSEIGAGESALAQLRFGSPIFAFLGDRFIIRDWSERATVAGGVVLDPEATRKSFRAGSRTGFLKERARSPNAVSVLLTSQLLRDRAIRRANFLLKSPFDANEIAAALTGLFTERKARLAGEWVIEAKWWQELLERAAQAIMTEHKAHPERPGLALTDLRSALERDLPAPELFDLLVEEICRTGFLQIGAALKAVAHRPALPPHLLAAGAKLRAALSARPLEPPSRKDLTPDPISQQALRFLLQTGEAVELGEEVVMLTENFHSTIEVVKEFLRRQGSATLSEIRQRLGTSRRIAVPLLERLDRDGVTARQGDQRRLRVRS